MEKKKNVPKLRFPEFTDTWEQRKFGDLCSIVTKQTGFDYTATIKKSLVTEASEDTLPYLQTKNFAGVSISYDTDYFIPKSVAKEFPKINLDEKCLLFSIVGASVGNIGLFPGDKHCFLSGAICVSKLNNLDDADYLYHYMCSENGQSQIRTCTKGGAQATITIEDIREICVLLPSEQERKKIGELLSSLDNLITLHQRKSEALSEYKKGMLQKMFPKKGEDRPEIRFPGFTDAWEQRKLEDYIIEYHEVTTENNQYPALTSSRKGIFLQTEYFAGNQIASDDNTGYNIVPYGYFTYRHMSDDEIFHFNINDIVENGIVSTLYPVFTTNDKLDSRYLQYQLNYGYEFARFAVLQKQGGSRTYMYLSKLKQLSLTMPKDVEEQKKISGFFMELDNLITLHRRKCEELREYKKGLLQQMFV